MPIHEYVCEDCAKEFEELVYGHEAVRCPRCDGARASKKLSTFATSRANGVSSARERAESAPSGGCGTCGDPRGPGACAM